MMMLRPMGDVATDGTMRVGAGWRLVLGVFTLGLMLAGCATTPRAGSEGARATSEILREAQGEKAVGLYLKAAESALAVMADESAPTEVRAEAEGLYNRAVRECVMALQGEGALNAGPQTYSADGRVYRVTVAAAKGREIESPARFDRLVDSTKVGRKHIKDDVRRSGLGGTLVGLSDGPRTASPNRPPRGFAEPVTAVVAFGEGRGEGPTPVEVTFYNPQIREDVRLQGVKYALSGDFTAPLAFFPRTRGLILGIVAMVRSDRVSSRSNIYFCEPYDPNKIPILFVHGLMSTPHAWINFVNELDRDPDFRKRYQPWVYLYPSGAPIAANAMRLRKDLAEVEKRYALKKNIVMVGHSMGGILTRMQVTDTGKELWRSIFRSRADAMWPRFAESSILKRALVFQPNPYVKRAIFFATPHQGSDLANLRISSLAASFIRLPTTFREEYDSNMRAMMRDIAPTMKAIPTSIIGLSPKSPLLKGMSQLPMKVPYHSIIGNQGKDRMPLAKSSDGVVPYWSSHVEGAESEVIVPTGHDAFDDPKSVTEMLRILALNR